MQVLHMAVQPYSCSIKFTSCTYQHRKNRMPSFAGSAYAAVPLSSMRLSLSTSQAKPP